MGSTSGYLELLFCEVLIKGTNSDHISPIALFMLKKDNHHNQELRVVLKSYFVWVQI